MINGNVIKRERCKRGLSQEQLGEMIHVSKVSICGYEKGTKTPTLENLLKLETTAEKHILNSLKMCLTNCKSNFLKLKLINN